MAKKEKPPDLSRPPKRPRMKVNHWRPPSKLPKGGRKPER